MEKLNDIFIPWMWPLGFLVGMLGCADSPPEFTQNPPNIIFILTDDQRWDALGFAGNQYAHTPEMDRLASQGLYFSHAMVSTPICSASRATILTGLYERSHRYDFSNRTMRAEFMDNSYPAELRKAGYYTGFYGKLGLSYDKADSLFDVYESYDRNNKYKDHRGYYYQTLAGDTVHLTRYTGQKALDFLDHVPEDQPFCLSLSFSAPHAHDGAPEQYFWEDDAAVLWADVEIPGPNLAESAYFDKLPEGVREGFNRVRWHWRYDTAEKYQHSIKGYYRMIAGIDREIGLIREKLHDQGLADNTVIMLMGDNGYFMGERQLAGKWLMYDNSVRVPLIIFDPRNPGPKVIDQMAMNIDIPVTILDLAGQNIPPGWQGKSLVQFLTLDTFDLERDSALIEHLWEFEHIPPSEGLRTPQWKYIRYRNDLSIEELYDLQNDPLETNNLARDPEQEDRLRQFRNHMDKMAVRYRDPLVGKPQELAVHTGAEGEIMEGSNQREGRLVSGFSWEIPEGARAQMSYQILVASGRDKLNINVGDMWNSGEQKTEESNHRPYLGPPLISGHEYFWKVRIWDEYHRLSDYSEADRFIAP